VQCILCALASPARNGNLHRQRPRHWRAANGTSASDSHWLPPRPAPPVAVSPLRWRSAAQAYRPQDSPPQKSPLGYTSRCEDPVGFGCRPSCLLVWHWPLGQASRGYQGSDSINYILDQSVNDYYFLHRGIRFTRLGPDPPPSDKRTVSRAAAPVKKMYYRLADEWPSSTLMHIHSVGELSLHHETLRTTQPYRSTHPPSAWREAGQNLPW
jgi:hypothetical protein